MTKIALTLLLLTATAAHAQTGPNGPWNPRPLPMPYSRGQVPSYMPQVYPHGHPAVTIPNPYAPPGYTPPGRIPMP